MEKFLKNFFNFTYNLLSFPYKLKWQPGLQIILKIDKNSVHFYFWLFGCFINFVYSVSCWALFFYLLPNYLQNKEYVHIAFHSEWAMVSVMILIHQIPHLKYSQDVIQLSQGTVKLINNLESQHFGQESFYKSKLFRTRLIFSLIVYSFIGFLPTITIIFLYFQHGNWQLGSFVYHTVYKLSEMKILARALGVLSDEWNVFYVWGTFYLSLHLNLAFMHTFKYAVIQMLEMGSKLGPKGSLKLLFKQNLIYSKLRILTTVYNGVYGIVYVPGMKSIFSVMLVQSVFVSVKLTGEVGGASGLLVTIFGIAGVVIIVILLPMFVGFTAMVHEYSEKFLKYLKKCGCGFQGELGRRIVRSFRKEAVRSGGMYDIEKITCLTVLALISNLCGSVLISVKL